jgi:hypothetical protein
MSDGQLAMNTNLVSPGLFLKDSNGDSVKVGPVHVGTTAPNATPGAGGQAGNSKGEQWLDTSSSRYVFKIWDGTAWRTEDGEFVNTSGDTMTGALGIIAGAAAAPGVFFSGDTNTGIYSPGADQVAISTNGTQRLTVDTAATTSTLPVVHPLGAVGTPSITFTGDLNTGFWSPSADAIAASTGGSERLRIDSSGRLLVGTSTSAGDGSPLQVRSNGVAPIELFRSSDDSTPGLIIINKSRGTTASPTVVTDGDRLGGFLFKGYSGAAGSYVEGARIQAFVDGEPDTSGDTTDMPTRLVFSTTADGASSPTERVRITSAGVLQIADAGNITVGTTTGTKIGTATTQKLGFYNATPVVQPTAVANATTAVDVITQLNDLLAKLRTLGIIAT